MTTVPASTALLQQLADCVCQNVAEHGVGPLCWCGLYPGGTPVWDYCGECDNGACGMGYVTVAAIQPYTTLGAAASLANCQYALQAIVNLGVARCLPMVEEGLPAPEEMATAAFDMHIDAHALLRAVECCLPTTTIVQGWTALPASGGCVGGEWTIIMDLEPQ